VPVHKTQHPNADKCLRQNLTKPHIEIVPPELREVKKVFEMNYITKNHRVSSAGAVTRATPAEKSPRGAPL
jgi:hypothetical protein